MVKALLADPEEAGACEQAYAVAELLQPDVPTIDGYEPEQRAVYQGISWERYLALDNLLGDDRSVPRLYYLGGVLEIMTTSNEHERIKKWMGNLLEMYLNEKTDIDITMRGQATMRLESKRAGAEPDESYCLGGEKEFPDLVLEIALTSGGVEKLELYRQFAVPEVWFWRSGKLIVHALRPDASGYELLTGHSRLLPGLDITLLQRCTAMRDWRAARQIFRAGLQK